MTRLAIIDDREITITPIFKMMEIENIPKSETEGYAVMEVKEMVEVHFAGSKNYVPHFPTDAFWMREGNRVLTYAERWPEQYQAFKQGNPQEANGTPLEMLRGQGITPELVSLCRALKIYSIEALYHLEGQALKNLGMNANRLKDAATAFMAEKVQGRTNFSELEALRAEIAALKASMVVPAALPPEQIEAIVQAADDAFTDMTDDQIKDQLKELTGARPAGNPKRATLVNLLENALAA